MLYLINKYGVSHMNFLKKTIGFLAVCGVVPAAYALTARPSSVNTVMSSRLPTMTAYLNGYVSSTTTSNLLDNAECIDAYTSCLKGADACGSNFEECTTKVLFHGKMPQCLSTLAQCSASGINALFGTSSTTALSNVAATNSYGEVTDYTYPVDGSVLGQLIIGAAISNMYDTSDCVRRYTTCLQRDNVCGTDFELCTTNEEFRKQSVYCDSTLARCQSEGKIELLGDAMSTRSPSADSRVGVMITEGAALAAVNAVSTCYKVVDQCILNACATNPYKCYTDSSVETANLVESIKAGRTIDISQPVFASETTTNSDVQSYIRNSCFSTIGANKYCYATFLGGGQMPTSSQLNDEMNQEDVFSEAYSSRMNSSMKARIAELIEDFDSDAKESCANTIKSCAMRVCGGGSGAACYSLVFKESSKSINGSSTYNEIKTGCSDIVNTDPYCQYAAMNPNDVGGYTYSYINNSAFDTLFPEYSKNSSDPIGVIASLNASLATSYNDAAIAQMRTQCENVAKSCVRSMCGSDYTGCYRNRTDVYSTLTNSGNGSYDASMNQVGGVLDYTVVLGLCLDTVKNASVCQEHLAIEQAKLKLNDLNDFQRPVALWGESWGSSGTVRDGWIDAGAATKVSSVSTDVQATDSEGNLLCTASDGTQGVCNTVDANGKIFDTPVYIAYTTYVQNEAASTLFRSLVYDLEKEAQAIYNKKLTEEQNACLASNNGGLMTSNDTGSTFMWSKLTKKTVSDDYTVMGLKRSDFEPSNELYGSFCSVQVRLQSDDMAIQEAMKSADWTTAYFAVGDTFTCGSWIPAADLEKLANAAASKATEAQRANQKRTEFWTTLLGTVGGTIGGAYLGSGIHDGSVFGKMTGLKKEDASENGKVSKYVTAIKNVLNKNVLSSNVVTTTDIQMVDSWMNSLESAARKLAQSNTINGAKNAVSSWQTAAQEYLDLPSDADTTIKTSKSNYIKTAAETAKTALDLLEAECEDSDDNTEKKWQWGSLVGAVVTGAAGGFLVNKATRDIQASNLSAAEKAAYEEWMDSVGRHLKCYIGTDEAGEYGDILSVTLN